MDLYQLKYFLEVARELSFTRAAANLGVSPSAVSRSVALLERSVGQKLLARTKRHVSLTGPGEALKLSASRIFDEVERARIELGGAAKAPERLRIATREMITNYLLPTPLAEYAAKYGGTAFSLHELEPSALAEALKKDQADLALHYTDIGDPAIEAVKLGRLNSRLYAARGSKERAFVVPRPFRPDGSPSADGWPDERFPRDVRYEAEFLETHRRFVLAGLCAGVLPDLVMRDALRSGKVTVLKSPPLHRDIYWLKRRGRVLPKAAEFLVSRVREAIQELG